MLGEYKQLSIFDIDDEKISLVTICNNIEAMFKKTLEEERYLEAWDEYIIKHRNTELETKINNNQVEVELEILKMFDTSAKEMFEELGYKYSNTLYPTIIEFYKGKKSEFQKIMFDNSCKLFLKSGEKARSLGINQAEFKAIQQQISELGW